jgi:putative peptidoglycan lipid II flippase
MIVATFWTAVILLISRFVGFLREILVAAMFGATAQTDAFALAFIIPEFFIGIWTGGIGSFALVPFFAESLANKERDKFNSLISTVLIISLVLGLILSALCLILSPVLIALLAPKFGAKILATKLLWIMSFSILFILSSCVLMAVHNVFNSFIIPVLSLLMFNIFVIIFVLLFGFKFKIYAWGIGILAGAFFSWLIQLPILFKHNLIKYDFNLMQSKVKEIFLYFMPIAFTSLIILINMQFDRSLGIGLGEGAAYFLYLTGRLILLPLGILAFPASLVSLPALARQRSRGDSYKLKKTIKMLFYFIVPVMLFLSAFIIWARLPLISFLFERGNFSRSASLLAVGPLIGYSVGLVGFSIIQIGMPVFYAFNEFAEPVIIAVGITVLNVVLSYLLLKPLGLLGISMATSIAATVGAGFILLTLYRRLKEFTYQNP